MKQRSLTVNGFEKYRKKTRKEIFLERMNHILPWVELCSVIEPSYPKPLKAGGRPAMDVERMLGIHFLQYWFEPSDPAAEEALYDIRSMRESVGIDLNQEAVPDEATICKFRHLMENHNLGEELFHLVNVFLAKNGLTLNRVTIVDGTIIESSRSTKNKRKQLGPEMSSASTAKMVRWNL